MRSFCARGTFRFARSSHYAFAGPFRRTEASMTRRLPLAVVAALVLLVNSTPTWGGSLNPTASDGNGNTAGGPGALQSVTPGGTFNTALGYQALTTTTTGDFNTATGVGALFSNTTGGSNTAGGFETLYFNSTGSFNTAFGVEALLIN